MIKPLPDGRWAFVYRHNDPEIGGVRVVFKTREEAARYSLEFFEHMEISGRQGRPRKQVDTNLK